MNIWVRRSLEATLLAAGFVVIGGGIASAAEPASEPIQQPAQLGKALPGLPDPTSVLHKTLGKSDAPATAKQGKHAKQTTHAKQAKATSHANRDGRNTTPRPQTKPARPVHAGLTVPVDTANNAVGTPLGQVDVPGVSGEVRTRDVTDPVQDAAAPVTAAAGPALDAAEPVTSAVNCAAGTVVSATRWNDDEQDTPFPRPDRSPAAPPHGDPFLGNRVNADLVVPVQLAGNALALGGPASVAGSNHSQSYDGSQDVVTGGAGTPLAGNVVDLDWAVPVQLANNAVGALGSAETADGNASQDTTVGGDDVSDGRGGFLSGNVVAGQWATPVQATGNAVSGLGTADVANSSASTTANSGGGIDTAGGDAFGSGNVGAAPLGLPIELNGNAPAALGESNAVSNTVATVTAGGTRPGVRNRPTYVQTDGDWALLGGNVVQPQGASVANVSSIAAAAGGLASAGATDAIADPFALPMVLGGSELRGMSMQKVWPLPSRGRHAKAAGSSSSTNDVTSGGYTTTSSRNGTGSGNIADAPAALPAEAFATGGSAVGQADAAMDNATDTTAGGKTFTNGNGSALSGNTASSPLAGTAEAFGGGATAVGGASGTATEDKNVKSGGYNGTLGNDSLGSGNVATTPLAAPVEAFGAGAAAVGGATGTASETKDVTSGSDGNTEDDYGTVSSNIAALPVALPAQVFGIGAGGVGHGTGVADAETTTTAGSDYKGTGTLGLIAGNIAQAPFALPTQVHGIGGGAIGSGDGLSTNLNEATAGGDNTTDGSGGTLTGNVVHTPAAGTAGVAAIAGSAIGESYGDAVNDVTSTSGGDTSSAGDNGLLAGNAVGLETLPIAGAFNTAASAISESDAYGSNANTATSGGDYTTSGGTGTLAGYVLDVPTATPAQVFDDSASALGTSTSGEYNEVVGTSGGDVSTDAGGIGQIPVVVPAQVADQEIELLGNATSDTVNMTDLQVGGTPLSYLPVIQ